ncbi:hypothetical protein DPMN_002258 [Dreissena polymorpha]|uniref:Uncharacterized protein n=1 Tax=Dreissena polymorpha TaxID=45954 RepID=A0A9D4RRK9_DREPO|nr:hypothetical protein DPMN_002258 [Dreissena polymorpha]
MDGTQDDELFDDLVENRDQYEDVSASAKVSDCELIMMISAVYDDNLTSEEFYKLFGESDDEDFEGF